MSGTAFPSTVTQVDLGTTASPQRFPLGYEVTLPATKGGAGGVTNNAGSGKTGDVLLTTVGHSSGDSYSIVIQCIKEF